MYFPLFFWSVKILLSCTKKNFQKIILFYIKNTSKNMLQGNLFTPLNINQQEVKRSGINASFVENGEGNYEVELTINSSKFLCICSLVGDAIASFEILAVKGIANLTTKLIKLLKETVQHLSYQIV